MNEKASRFRHLIAELQCFPLTSTFGFQHCFSAIPARGDDPGVADFYLECESLAKRHSLTTNEFTRLRDKLWWDANLDDDLEVHHKDEFSISLSKYFTSLAKQTLEVDGSTLRPRLSEDDPTYNLSGPNRIRFARESLSWLGRELPLDILEASLQCEFKTHSWTIQIERMLEREFAEVHVHLGASVSFDEQWHYLQGVLRLPNLKFDFLKTPHGSFRRGTDFGTWLIVCSMIRYLLADFLVDADNEITLDSYLNKKLLRLARHGLDVKLLRHCIASFLKPYQHNAKASQQRFLQIQSLHRHLALPIQGKPRSFDELNCLDPIERLVHADRESIKGTCERVFIAMALSKIASQDDQNKDKLFERLFWQTQRIRTLFFRHIVQQQGVPGLAWFTRYYRRISPSRKGTTSDAIQFIGGAINNGFGIGLKSYEVRGAPPKATDLVAADIDQIRTAALTLNSQTELAPENRIVEENLEPGQVEFDKVTFEAGLTYHFVKARERGDPDELSIRGHDGHDQITEQSISKYVYGDYFKKIRASAKATADTLQTFPLALLWLRAVDVCNDELAMPTWLFCQPYKMIVEASVVASQYLLRRFGQRVRPVRPSSHVGEDFSHLLTGLRRIDESLEFLGITEGDRIGHGLALGTEPLDWAAERGPVTMSPETRLFDLVWAKEVLGTIDANSTNVDGSRLDLEIEHLTNRIFLSVQVEDRPDVSAIQRMRRNFTDYEKLRQVGFPNRDPGEFRRGHFGSSNLRNDSLLMFRYLTDRQIHKDARSAIHVNPINQGSLLLAIQNELRRKVAARGVAVEVNPTSNLVVGNYPDLSKHPMWRLNCPGYSDEIPPVSLCVGSDDPLIFATNLPQEYQRLSDALGHAGFSEVQIYDWLDKVRAKSLEVRNTLPITSFAPVTSISRDWAN